MLPLLLANIFQMFWFFVVLAYYEIKKICVTITQGTPYVILEPIVEPIWSWLWATNKKPPYVYCYIYRNLRPRLMVPFSLIKIAMKCVKNSRKNLVDMRKSTLSACGAFFAFSTV